MNDFDDIAMKLFFEQHKAMKLNFDLSLVENTKKKRVD